MTVREDIWNAIDAIVAPLAVEWEREPSGDPARFPALAGYDNGHVRLDGDAYLSRRQMAITIEGYVEGEFGLGPTLERSELNAAVVAALMADETLGGLIEQIEDTDLRMSTALLAERRRLMFAQDFTVQFVTRRTDPAQPA